MLLVKDGYLVNFAHFDHTIDNKDKPKENLGEQKELLPAIRNCIGIENRIGRQNLFHSRNGYKESLLQTFFISFC